LGLRLLSLEKVITGVPFYKAPERERAKRKHVPPHRRLFRILENCSVLRSEQNETSNQFHPEVLARLKELADDSAATFQELADEAFDNLLKTRSRSACVRC
jgi:hypothetical protein